MTRNICDARAYTHIPQQRVFNARSEFSVRLASTSEVCIY
jgi:hypothetical protein